MDRPMMIGGFRVFIENPFKTFKRKIVKNKLKKIRRNLKVKVHSGYMTILKDNEIIKNDLTGSIHMTAATWQKYNLALEARKNQF